MTKATADRQIGVSAAASVVKATVAVAVPLLWANRIRPASALDQRGRTAANVVFATSYALALRGRPHWNSRRGLRSGFGAAAAVIAGYAVAVAVPPLRARVGEFAGRDAEADTAEWVAIHIPIGTVYSEELVFRATLDPVLDTVLGPRLGPIAGAATFGLWHIDPARAAGDSIPATVFATALGGAILSALARRTGSTTAPALLHLAVNTGGVLAPRLARLLVAR
ncbi:CPBP family intramembrane glutamic endopeptidase [Nocardia arizonensis]|uniref:CPBP family intramembrane glutamic endopeptidase n=1 Tax=Nocardia arizonensis TaxID=1141647 RepID=UPI001EF66972|nr:CPBP family intramembrane glutamic endopeptidase [Nocardia arizonensis]